MKKIFILVISICLAFIFAGCTHNYTEPYNPQAEPESATEEMTEKEELVPLLFEDENNDIYLYGIRPDGVILYTGGEGHYFDWEYSCSDYRDPKIFKGNFDGNNTQDIAIVTYAKNKDVSVEDLRIISDGDFDEESIYMINEDEFNSYASNLVDSSFSNNSVTLTLDDISYSFDLSESFEKLVFDGICYNENVTYELIDDEIYVNIIPVAKSSDEYNDYGKVNLDITLKAKLLFDGYNISLADASLAANF